MKHTLHLSTWIIPNWKAILHGSISQCSNEKNHQKFKPPNQKIWKSLSHDFTSGVCSTQILKWHRLTKFTSRYSHRQHTFVKNSNFFTNLQKKPIDKAFEKKHTTFRLRMAYYESFEKSFFTRVEDRYFRSWDGYKKKVNTPEYDTHHLLLKLIQFGKLCAIWQFSVVFLEDFRETRESRR